MINWWPFSDKKTTENPADPKLRPELNEKNWKSENAWNKNPAGRLAIRLVTRGIMGAGFFAVGNALSNKWLGTSVEASYEVRNGLFEQKNPLQYVAKFIDATFGKTIKGAVELATGSEVAAENAVHFRPTKWNYNDHFAKVSTKKNPVNISYNFKSEPFHNHQIHGRTLGHEVAGVTFDFFCASIGDAMGRDIVDLVDPHNKNKPWLNKDGKFDFKEAAKKTGKAAFRYVTYNGGEDWAVAIPYVYFMKGQRAVLNHFSPGFKYDFDRGLNGGSFKLDDKHNVIGNYAVEGAFDLQTRFTAYNIGTLMYREAYDYVANRVQGKPAALFGAPDQEPPKGIIAKASNVAKWALRDAIKATIYMTPAVPFFWGTRITQQRHEGLFIHPTCGVLSNVDLKTGEFHSVRAHNVYDKTSIKLKIEDNTYYAKHIEDINKIKAWDFPNPTVSIHHGELKTFDPPIKHFDVYESGNPVARFNNKAANVFSDRIKKYDRQVFTYDIKSGTSKKLALSQKIYKAIGLESFTTIPKQAIRAAFSYTPYMYVKREAAGLWDTGKMDLATEGFVDAAFHLDFQQAKNSVGEMWSAYTHQPFADKVREEEGKRRIEIDTSPTVDVSRDEKKNELSWEERIIESKKEKSDTLQTQNYLDRLKQQKVLDKINPQTAVSH